MIAILEFATYRRCPRGLGDVDAHQRMGLVHRVLRDGTPTCIDEMIAEAADRAGAFMTRSTDG